MASLMLPNSKIYRISFSSSSGISPLIREERVFLGCRTAFHLLDAIAEWQHEFGGR